jgi:Immunity protein 63
MPLSLQGLKAEYKKLCRKLGATGSFHTNPQHDGSPHVERRDSEYHYVVTERGSEFERKTTSESDEVLYWLLSDVTFSAACSYELAHRIAGQDFRRLLFAKDVELLEQLSSGWAERKKMEIADILAEYPFDDTLAGERQHSIDEKVRPIERIIAVI